MYMILLRVIIVLVCCFLAHIITTHHTYRRQNTSIAQIQHQRKKEYAQTAHTTPTYDYLKLHELFYNGVPDKYDLRGNKIKGIAPDPKKSIHYLRMAGNFDKQGSMWLKLASIYQNGMYNFEPDLAQARSLYQEIINKFQLPSIVNAAQDGLADVIKEINNIQIHRWLNLKYTTKKNTHHDKIKAMLARAGQNRATGAGAGAGLVGRGVLTRPVQIRPNELFRAGTNAGSVDINAINHNDNHNTHNSQVVGTVAHSLNKLKANTTIKSPLSDTLRDIRNFLSGKSQCDKTLDAYKSLDSIERNIIPITSIDMKESEALNILWNRINDDKHAEHSNDIKDMFYNQLADMQEHGKSVCATGRLSRLVDTLNTFDDDVVIKPTYVINQEMMDKAGKIRETLYEGLPVDQANKLRAGTAPEQDEFDAKARETIVSSLTKDYVDTGIMTENAFTTNVEGWIDEI